MLQNGPLPLFRIAFFIDQIYQKEEGIGGRSSGSIGNDNGFLNAITGKTPSLVISSITRLNPAAFLLFRYLESLTYKCHHCGHSYQRC